MNELWPVYNNLGEPTGQNKSPADMLAEGSLHAASHVWMWRRGAHEIEVLIQKRSSTIRTWPNKYITSAAGHIDVGETPVEAAIRETKEEIGLSISPSQLTLIGVYRGSLVADADHTENEFQWLYLIEITSGVTFKLQQDEVASLEWLPLSTFKRDCLTDTYVPLGELYYRTVIDAIESADK